MTLMVGLQGVMSQTWPAFARACTHPDQPTGRQRPPWRTQVCGSAGDTTTLRSVEPPYSYSSKESRRAARKRASIFTELIEEEKLEISNASPWPGGWQSRISAKSHKV